MRSLHHFPFDPLSRMVRLILLEKGLDCNVIDAHPLDNIETVLAHNPAGTLPILLDEPPTGGEIAVCPTGPIVEYLEEAYPLPALMPSTSAGRAETRRLMSWFHDKFHREVTPLLTGETIDRRLRRQGQPDPDALRAGRDALLWHMDYINFLCEQRSWLAGERMSVVDLACAAEFSCLDYCGYIPWADFSDAKDWYARIKSRPSFKPLLAERVPGLPASRQYADLDF